MQDAAVLKQALPYINEFAGATFVIKAGGDVTHDRATRESIAGDVALLHRVGIRVVVVHGGGPQASDLSRRLGLDPVIVNGRRVTDDAALEVVTMVFAGRLNTEMLSALRRAGVRPVGLSGVDAGLVAARRRPAALVLDHGTGEERTIDFGHVGDVEAVDTRVLDVLLGNGYIPVVCSLAADDEGNLLNVNADTVAAVLAGGLGAAKLILLTGVPGVLADATNPASALSTLTAADARAGIVARRFTGGMAPKLEACVTALSGGVAKAHILDGRRPAAILEEVFTAHGAGTEIVP